MVSLVTISRPVTFYPQSFFFEFLVQAPKMQCEEFLVRDAAFYLDIKLDEHYQYSLGLLQIWSSKRDPNRGKCGDWHQGHPQDRRQGVQRDFECIFRGQVERWATSHWSGELSNFSFYSNVSLKFALSSNVILYFWTFVLIDNWLRSTIPFHISKNLIMVCNKVENKENI